MARIPQALLFLLLTLSACDEQGAPCSADDAAGMSSSSGGESSSTGTTEPQGPECVFALGQCWCDGDLTAIVPGSDRTCMCGDAVAPTDACQPATDCAVGDDLSCHCRDFQGEPRVGSDASVADGRLCFCGQQPAVPFASDGGNCLCGSEQVFGPLCYTWDGSTCLDMAGSVVQPRVDDGVCSCGMTVLEQEHCTG